AQSYRGAQLKSQLSPELTRQIKKLCQQQGTTLFMTLLGAFNSLLYRYTNQDDILIGSPAANRPMGQTEGIIGFFVNTLVLRSQITANTRFVDLLKQLRQTPLEAYANQDVPFEQLVEHLKPQRSLSYNPLFQVMFALQNNTRTTLSLPQLEIRELAQDTEVAQFDLSLDVIEGQDTIELNWEYATDLFQASTIQRLSEHFTILLQGIIDNPQAEIQSLALLTNAETQQLSEWNQSATSHPVPANQTIVTLFEQQVAKNPDNIAAVLNKGLNKGLDQDRAPQQLSYRALNENANQLAHYLKQTYAIGADTLVMSKDGRYSGNAGRTFLVAICVERSLDMMISLLAVLKTGAAYVPLDPSAPQERLRHILQDSQTPLLLTQSHLKARLPQTQSQIFCLA
ncbi:MAG: condensation domain-containing protein, partial [Psychrosphaera sp.]|nr:condensation domain-containing protein [Psychrosphaera sp.]